jgi:short-chain fatty acids transporter
MNAHGDVRGRRQVARITNNIVVFFERWMPDSFVVAVFLSVLTFALAITAAGATPTQAITAWGDGFWDLLTFTTQVVLTLLLGYALAYTPLMQRALKKAAGTVRSSRGAYLTVAFVSCGTALFSWALGLVAGAVMARTVGAVARERGIPVHYPLLVACAYAGIVIWHQGLSASIGLAIATPGHFLENSIGIIPTSQTLFTTWNAITAAVILLTLPFVMARLRPADEACRPLPASLAAEDAETADTPASDQRNTPASRLENSRVLNVLFVVVGVVFLFIEFVERGKGLNLNLLNFTFLVIGVALSRSPIHYLGLIVTAAKVVGPFLLQYPFYAGIAGMMADTGLARMVLDLFVQVSTAQTLPLTTFFSGAILNLFIPSGGGQWAVQGPIAMQSAIELGANVPITAMAVAFGDQWTNLIQPLIAIPVLAIAGLHVRDIMGYCAVALFYTGPIFVISILLMIYV